MLKVHDLHVSYGGIHALRGVSLDVNEGEIVTIIGANGAGKSTLLNAISGFLKPSKGEVVYKERVLGRQPAKLQRPLKGHRTAEAQLEPQIDEGLRLLRAAVERMRDATPAL